MYMKNFVLSKSWDSWIHKSIKVDKCMFVVPLYSKYKCINRVNKTFRCGSCCICDGPKGVSGLQPSRPNKKLRKDRQLDLPKPCGVARHPNVLVFVLLGLFPLFSQPLIVLTIKWTFKDSILNPSLQRRKCQTKFLQPRNDVWRSLLFSKHKIGRRILSRFMNISIIFFRSMLENNK